MEKRLFHVRGTDETTGDSRSFYARALDEQDVNRFALRRGIVHPSISEVTHRDLPEGAVVLPVKRMPSGDPWWIDRPIQTIAIGVCAGVLAAAVIQFLFVWIVTMVFR